MSVEDMVQCLSTMAQGCEELDPSFVAKSLNSIDHDHLDMLTHGQRQQREKFISNLTKMFSSDGGKVLLSELCVGLSILVRSNPLFRMVMVIGLYKEAAVIGLTRTQVFHFLQQICRFLMSLTTLHDETASDVNIAAMEMMESVFQEHNKQGITSADSNFIMNDQKQQSTISIEFLTQWWLRMKLDADNDETSHKYLNGTLDKVVRHVSIASPVAERQKNADVWVNVLYYLTFSGKDVTKHDPIIINKAQLSGLCDYLSTHIKTSGLTFAAIKEVVKITNNVFDQLAMTAYEIDNDYDIEPLKHKAQTDTTSTKNAGAISNSKSHVFLEHICVALLFVLNVRGLHDAGLEEPQLAFSLYAQVCDAFFFFFSSKYF